MIAQGLLFSDAKIRWWTIPFPLKFALKVTPTPFQTALFRPLFAHSASTVRAGEKVQLALIGSRSRAFQRAIDELCTLPLSAPKGGTKRNFVIFPVNFNFCRKQVATKFLCVKTSSGIIPLSKVKPPQFLHFALPYASL